MKWKLIFPPLMLLALVAGLVMTQTSGEAVKPQILIKPMFPKPVFMSGPWACNLPHLEKSDVSKVIKQFYVPAGTSMVSVGKAVTASAAPLEGSALTFLTDGDNSSDRGTVLVLPPGKQWVQIDLGQSMKVQKIHLWHAQSQLADAYLDLVVQVSEEAAFRENVVTLFNADFDGSLGFGKGSDPAYVETNHGRVIDGGGARARYVRLWSAGSFNNGSIRFAEVAVYASPLE
jgi:hypothetical protein